jgi:acetolactate synthase I/II/III large subunit
MTLGAKIIWDTLAEEGVDTVFGYPGGAILPAYDALLDSSMRHVLVRHEQGAAHMADGYARASGRVGVCIATSGPGAINLATGIGTAMMDSSPIVCITGQVPSTVLGTDAFQEADVVGVTLSLTKHNYLVTNAADIAPVIREAFHVARSGRPGPVLVDITKDAQQAHPAGISHRRALNLKEPEPLPNQELEQAAELIATSKRPLLLCGHGVLLSNAADETLAFAEKTEMPVALTLLGLGGFPCGHPLYLGMMGMHGEAWVNQAIQEADLLISFGMRFDDRVTGKLQTYAKNAKKIHIDIDPSEIGKVVPVEVGLVGDLKNVVQQLLPRVHRSGGDWLAHIESLKADAVVRDIASLPDNGHLYAAHVIGDLWRISEGDATICSDVGQHQMWAAQYYRHRRPRTCITSGGLGTMGFALPAAIGAKIARPEEEVWVIAGDGGFQMTAAELSTCAQEDLKLNIAIINNGYLGMVRQWQEFFYNRRYAATPMKNPDFVMLANAHGLEGIRVDKRSEVEPAVRRARESKQTVVIDFRVEKEDTVYPMVASGKDLHDMIRRPLPERSNIL